MIDQIRRDIQALLEELLGAIGKLRRALAALTSRGSEPASADRAAPADAGTASEGEGAKSESKGSKMRWRSRVSRQSPGVLVVRRAAQANLDLN